MRCELCGDFDAPAFLKVGAIEPPQAELAVAGALQEQRSDMRFFRISADDPNAIVKVGFGLRDRLPVDDPNQWSQCEIDENDKARRHGSVQWRAAARQQSHGCRAPQCGCGIEAGDMKSFAKDDPCTQEADPGDNLGGHPRGTSVVRKQTFEDYKTCRADSDQRIGPQAGHPLTPLAFESDACAQKGGHTEADSCLINRTGHWDKPL